MATNAGLTTLRLSEAELAARRLDSHTLQAALEALHTDGAVALANAVAPAHLDALRARMLPDAYALHARSGTHRNFGAATGNFQQEPPVADPALVFADVLANPWAVEVAQCVLGPRPALRFYSANTLFRTDADAADARQPPHVDVDLAGMPRLPFGLCVNVCLDAVAPDNGATELWLGSHAEADGGVLEVNERGHQQVRADLLEMRRIARPPVQPRLPKGALVIRDFRLWHAGMPNHTDEPRIMLVSVLFPYWYRANLKMKLAEKARDTVDWGDVVGFLGPSRRPSVT